MPAIYVKNIEFVILKSYLVSVKNSQISTACFLPLKLIVSFFFLKHEINSFNFEKSENELKTLKNHNSKSTSNQTISCQLTLL